MRKLVFTTFILSQWLLVHSQLLIQWGAGFKTTGDILITVEGAGITNNDASADFSNATLTLKGTNNISINGTGSWMVKKIILDKPALQLTLGVPIQIINQLQFVYGTIDLNNQILTLSGGATIEGENNTSRIVGPNGGYVQTTVSLNAPSAKNPGNIGAQITSNQNLGSVTIKRWHKPDGNSLGKILRFYEVIPANNTSVNASLRLYYLDAELNNNQESSLDLFTRSNSQNAWIAVTGTAKNVSLNYIEKTGLASLQQYSFGTNSMGALSLTWGPVSASCKKGKIEVKWSTLQESGINHFIIQRSTNGSVWTDLGTVPAKGNSTSVTYYSYIDATALSGIGLFYRIAAVENEGYSYSGIASTTGCKNTTRMQLAPVPATTTINLCVYSDASYQCSIRLYGVDGRTYQQRNVTITAGYSRLQFDISGLPAGTYYLQVGQPDGSSETISFVKQ